MGFDFVFVGGGLSSALATLAVLARHPAARIAVVERGSQLGQSHTWCFHARDAEQASQAFLQPLIAHRWPGYSVRFPRRERRLASAYACVTGERLHDVLSSRLGHAPACELLLGRTARSIERTRVVLDDGRELSARLVVDARGPDSLPPNRDCGYQKFVGLELAVQPGHALREPLLIDAMLPQLDGLRFMYVLPLGPDRVLVEETFFSDNPRLDEAACQRAILAYAAQLGLTVRALVRRERGVLPMPWRSEPPRVSQHGPLRAGYGGGWFNPVTGYSFPLAARFATALEQCFAKNFDLAPLRALAARHEAQLGYLLTLTRTMFTWFEPAGRYGVLEHFYRLPEPLIKRFYAATLTPLDRARIFLGAPPRGLSMRRMLSTRVEAMS